MTTELQRLIDAIRETGDRPGHTVERMSAKLRLADYVLDHAVDIAERDRLERAVVETFAATRNEYDLFDRDKYNRALIDAQNALSAFLIAQAEESQ